MAITESAAAIEGHSLVPATTGRRDWLDVTVRLATSWVGLFAAYAAAVTLAISNVKALKAGFTEMGLPPWGGIALLAALPLLALVLSTIPTIIDKRRINRYAEIKVDVRAGYFTLRPRETEETFERVDNAHQETLRWIENAKEPVLYLTGASGTGKSSLLAAWVIPKLKREGNLVIQLRGYEQLFERIKDRLLEPGFIWTQPTGKDSDLRSLLERASQRLGGRRLILVIDQFEEFLILKDQEQQKAFQQFLLAKAIPGLTFLLIFRPEYEGLIQDQGWPRLQLDTNRKVISPFTENVAIDFLSKSGLALNTELMRAVMREATEIEQGAVGLIRPVTINLCGLVLSRFSSGLSRRFRGGIIRGFLRESLLLPEVRDVAEKLVPTLITDNITKRPRTIEEMAKAKGITTSAVRACMRRLGENDRAIVRPLDEQQETWEISHDFLVPLLDGIVARRTISLWRRVRPWMPWTAAAVMGAIAVAIPRIAAPNVMDELRKQGWTISDKEGLLVLSRSNAIPSASIPILRALPPPYELDIVVENDSTLATMRDYKGLTGLDLEIEKDVNLSALQDVKGLRSLELEFHAPGLVAIVPDVSGLLELKGLTELRIHPDMLQREIGPKLTSDLAKINGLNSFGLIGVGVKDKDLSLLLRLKDLNSLDLSVSNVRDISVLHELKHLSKLNLNYADQANLSVLPELTSLTWLDLGKTAVSDGDIESLSELRNLTNLSLADTSVTHVSPLKKLGSLKTLDITNTHVTDLSSLKEIKGLTIVQ